MHFAFWLGKSGLLHRWDCDGHRIVFGGSEKSTDSGNEWPIS